MKFSQFHKELTEAKKFKKGDSVKIKDVKKYDALAKDDEGTVIGMMGSKVMVKVGTGQMNVDPKDLILESDELTEAKKLRNVLTDAEMEKSMKKALADKANWKGGKVNWNFIDADMYMELTAKGYDLRAPSIDYMNRFDKLADKLDPEMNESLAYEPDDLAESKDHAATKDMMQLAKDMNNRDTRAIQVLMGKINNFTSTGNRGMMSDMAKAMKSLDTSSQASVVKILNKHDPSLLKSILGKAGLNQSLVEGRNGSPDGDRNTTAENPLIIIFDDEFKAGKPGMSGHMNLKTWMSIHGINKRFQKELAQSVLDAGEGKQVEVSKKVLKDTHDEYKEEGIRPRRYWIELSAHHFKEVK